MIKKFVRNFWSTSRQRALMTKVRPPGKGPVWTLWEQYPSEFGDDPAAPRRDPTLQFSARPKMPELLLGLLIGLHRL